jgi:hypothetical protein
VFLSITTKMKVVAVVTCAVALLKVASALAPRWTPTWNMKSSTIIQPCNNSGFVEPIEFYAQFAIVDFDWSNAKALWVAPPMTDDLMLLQQCALLKDVNPDTRCFVYRNLVKGEFCAVFRWQCVTISSLYLVPPRSASVVHYCICEDQ